MVGETLDKAVIDTGCPHTVAGNTWFKSYFDTLSHKDRSSIKTGKSPNKFRFGDGIIYPSQQFVIIPIYISNIRYKLRVDIVMCNVPLLLSRETLQRGNAKIDIGSSSMCFLGSNIPLYISSSGHMCLRIGRPLDFKDDETKRILSSVLFTSPINGIGLDLKNKARKLHVQFCHPSASRLIDLVKDAGTTDQNVFDAITEISAKCDTCLRHKKPPLKPTVCFPIAKQFNETVALDLKSRGSDGYILHMIDHLTRYSAACLITDKKKETIVKGMMDYWIRIFGSPKYFLTDNGGEFVNKDVMDFAEKYNIILKTTAAESPWSNGLCERHNGILNNNVNKIVENNLCSLQVAIHWAVAAKNSLMNVYGFSPNILVFGRNPNYPTAFNNSPPANNMNCLNDYVAENLNAMHLARKSFIEQESAERLRRALNRKSRTYANNDYFQGDKVYYWRNDQLECHGPAFVVGKDGKQILLKHGGSYIRVHPCRIQHCSTEPDVERQIVSSLSNCDDHQSAPTPVHVIEESETSDNSDVNEVAENDIGEVAESDVNEIAENDAPIHTEWTHVTDNKNLPQVNSVIECRFPNYDHNIKCKVVSKAGKSSTKNWHFLNIKEDGNDLSKCCSFKDVSWRSVINVNDAPSTETSVDTSSSTETSVDTSSSIETFYGGCVDDPVYDTAKQEEIEKWKHFETFLEVPDEGQTSISTRWVCTRKIKGGQVRYKARLVARGFEEKTQHLKKDSPTCAKESLRFSLTVISCKNWKLHSLDVKSAFLQGAQMEREVFIRPPVEAHTSGLWKMLRCPYGLADSGRLWYLRLKEALLEAEMSTCSYDHAVFMWFQDNNLDGIVVCHVDDILFGGSTKFHDKVIKSLKSVFTIGLEEDTNLKYLGLKIMQQPSLIQIFTDEYANSLKELPVQAERDGSSEGFSPKQITMLKQFCGQVNWLTTQGRPDIAFQSCFLSNSLKSDDPNAFVAANKIVRKVQHQSVTLRFHQDFDISSCYVVSFTDASFANLPNAGSQGSYITLLIDQNGLYSPLAWQSRKVRRVVKSTIAAECLAAVEAAEVTIYTAHLIMDVMRFSTLPKTYVFCDNKNLVKAAHSSTNIEDKRLIIDVSILRDLLERKELTEFIWVPTEDQLANALTKQGASDKLLLRVFNESLCFDFDSIKFK